MAGFVLKSTGFQQLFPASSSYHMFTDFRITINVRVSCYGIIPTFVHFPACPIRSRCLNNDPPFLPLYSKVMDPLLNGS